MNFTDIVALDSVKRKLQQEFVDGKIPHALMLCGPAGNGALPLALAYAKLLLCKSPEGAQPCCQCSSCAMSDVLAHPDMHFVFPIYKRNGSSKPTYCDEFVNEWRDMVLAKPYADLADWMECSGATTQQLMIYESESSEIIRKLSMKATQGDRKIMLIWLPEKMHEVCANKILKVLEEPYPGTVFILVCEHPEALLATIRSRVQTVDVPPLSPKDIDSLLVERYGVLQAEASRISRAVDGNVALAMRIIKGEDSFSDFFELFKDVMRMAYSRNVKGMKAWSEQVASLPREQQKAFLDYFQRMIRESFVFNFHNSQLNYLSDDEQAFVAKFSPFVNERNIMGIFEQLSLVQRQIQQNASAKIVLFDFALKLIVYIVKNN